MKTVLVCLIAAVCLLGQQGTVTQIGGGSGTVGVTCPGTAPVGSICVNGKFYAAGVEIGGQGPAGPAGPSGPAGPAGADGAAGVPGYSPNTLLSGGGVTWTSGLLFRVSAATYIISNTRHSSAETTVTLSAADATNDRIDVIAVNDVGEVVVVEGTAAATPAKPSIDPSTQLEISFITVAATATSPANVASTSVYAEGAGGEWTASVSGAGMTLGSTSNPHAGTKDIEATAVTSGQYAQFQAAAPVDLSTLNTLSFYIRSKATWVNKRSLQIYFLSTGTRVGSIVTLNENAFGFVSSTTSDYQLIVIPVSLFAANGTVNQLRISVAGSSTAIGFYLDDITLQSGVANATAPSSMSWRGTWSSTASYAVNDTVYYGGTSWVARASSVNSTPAAANTNWSRLSGPIASGTAVLGTSGIASGACATAVTVAATGVLTTDVIVWTPNADISGVTGYAPLTTGGLSIYPYPTADNVNFKVCNPTASPVTPGAVTLNWRVVR